MDSTLHEILEDLLKKVERSSGKWVEGGGLTDIEMRLLRWAVLHDTDEPEYHHEDYIV